MYQKVGIEGITLTVRRQKKYNNEVMWREAFMRYCTRDDGIQTDGERVLIINIESG